MQPKQKTVRNNPVPQARQCPTGVVATRYGRLRQTGTPHIALPQDGGGAFTNVLLDYSSNGSFFHTYEGGYAEVGFLPVLLGLASYGFEVSNNFGGIECPYVSLVTSPGKKKAYLFFAGYAYTNTEQVTVIVLHQSGDEQNIIFNQDCMISDLLIKTNCSHKEPTIVMVGKDELEQLIDKDDSGGITKGYCPFKTIPLGFVHPDKMATYMRAYNEANYLWAGPECNDNVHIYTPYNTKPCILKDNR